MTLYSYEIGTTGGGMVNLESLTTPVFPPRSEWQEFSQTIDLANAAVRGGGWGLATWRWGFLSIAQYNQLRTFCTGKSAFVYINTKKDNETYESYYSVIIWPERPRRQAGRSLELTLEFRLLSVYSP